MPDSNVEAKYLITAKDLTKAALASADAGVQKFSKSLAKFSLVTGALAGAVVFKTMIEETLQQEKALKQLEARLASTKGVSGQTKDGLIAMADSLSKVTTFSDDAINSMQGLLLQFTRVRGGEFVAAQEQILNVATALGTDLQGAAMQVGKALNDPIKGITQLGRAGITFSEEQKEMIKTLVETGRVADAQKMILQGLETQFGGAARAARETLGGSLVSLKNAFGDLLEANGPGTETMRKSVESLIKVLQDPKTIAAANSFTGAMITGFTKVVDLLVETDQFMKFIGESLAKAVGGSAEPIERIDEKIKDTNAELKMLGVQIQAIQHGAVIPGAEEKFDAAMNQLVELQKQRKMMVEEANRTPIKPVEEPTGAQAFAGSIGEVVDPPVPGGMTEEQKEKELERIQDFLRSREELIVAQFAKENEFILANMEAGAARDDLLERLAEKHQKDLTDIQNKGLTDRDKFLRMTTKNKLAFMLQSTMQELAGVAQTNKTLFKINKVATLANIVLTAPEAIATSIKNAGGLPWGAWAGVLTAAKYVGLWQAAQGTEFGSGGGAPSAAGTGSGAPSMVDTPGSGMGPPRMPNEELTGRAGNTMQIHVYGNIIGMEQLQRVVGQAFKSSVDDEIITVTTDGRRAEVVVN